jgi:hypothetical protein
VGGAREGQFAAAWVDAAERESFTYMPLRKLPVTHMSWKSFQIIVCHALKIR